MSTLRECAYCRFLVPKGASVCGHCQGELAWVRGYAYSPEDAASILAEEGRVNTRTAQLWSWRDFFISAALMMPIVILNAVAENNGILENVVIGIVAAATFVYFAARAKAKWPVLAGLINWSGYIVWTLAVISTGMAAYSILVLGQSVQEFSR